ncbi:MAG TPA: MarC family protein, partial [Candidatus Goldiibacteriota bacterium]|nr:MarC family protein [Candidatus Goldiibacteriota bacterium]
MFKEYLLAFIPVFVAVDVIGLLPIFISLTREMGNREIKKVLTQSFITGVTLALVFIFIGKWIFAVL